MAHDMNTDAGSELEEIFRSESIAKALAAAHPAGESRIDCIDCTEPIDELRRARVAGCTRCTDCQGTHERLSRRFAH